jgi:hypothetical protein
MRLQIVGANKFCSVSAEIADNIRRHVEVLQSGLQVLSLPLWRPLSLPLGPHGKHTEAHAMHAQLEAIEQNNEILNKFGGLYMKVDVVASDIKDVVFDVKDVASDVKDVASDVQDVATDVRGMFAKVVPVVQPATLVTIKNCSDRFSLVPCAGRSAAPHGLQSRLQSSSHQGRAARERCDTSAVSAIVKQAALFQHGAPHGQTPFAPGAGTHSMQRSR